MGNRVGGSSDERHRIVAEARKAQAEREKGYRARALEMYPWVCGHCARELTHKDLHLLEVHHRDHNHDNNPPDGSNWELLCTYCHENQHARFGVANAYADGSREEERAEDRATYQPFAGLADLLKKD